MPTPATSSAISEPAAGVWPVVVVGAGAAGLVTALFAARAGARVLLLETRPQPGAKIRVSGGGRCNVLPSQVRLDDFHTSGSQNTLRNILFSWPLAAVREFFEVDLGIPLKQEATGKLFPVSERPQDVVEALLAAGARAGVTLVTAFRVTALRRGAADANFELEASDGRRVRGARLVVATGGLSLPKTGSDGGGLAMAQALGVPIAPTYPALVPLLVPDARWRALTGIALAAQLRAVRGTRIVAERERELLFTHRGLSGPVVLDMSRCVTAPGAADVRLLARWGGTATPDWETALRPAGKRRVATVLREVFPERLADLFLELAAIEPERRECDLSRGERQRLVGVLTECPLPVSGSEGYATAEVTGGGIPLAEVDAKTLASRRVPQLYFCGEILDAVGHIGGYNFLWAWVTGRKCGLAVAAARA